MRGVTLLHPRGRRKQPGRDDPPPDSVTGLSAQGLKRYRLVLGIPVSAPLLATSLLARMPVGIAPLSILLRARVQTGSLAVAGFAVGGYALAGALAAPVQGKLLDRWRPAAALAISAFAEATLLCALAFAGRNILRDPLVLILLSSAAGATQPPIGAYLRTLWPNVMASPDLLEAAYSLDAVSQEVILIAGPLIVALLGSPTAALALSAACVLAGTFEFVALPVVRGHRPPSARSGRRNALGSSRLRSLLCSSALVGFAFGCVEIGFPALGVAARSRASAGFLLSLWAVGSMIGGLVYGARRWPSSLERRYPRLIGGLALTIAPLALVDSLGPAFALSVFAGLFLAPIVSCQYSLIDRVANPGTKAEAFTWQWSTIIGGAAAGSAAAGAIASSGGPAAAFAAAAASAALATVLAAILFGTS